MTVVENAVREAAIPQTEPMGRSGNPAAVGSRSLPRLSDEDQRLWDEHYADALSKGAGDPVARYVAHQRIRDLHERRDGIRVPGAQDFMAYR